MRAETEARVKAFRRALELASQTLAAYLKEDGSNLHPYIIGTKWNEDSGAHGHVITALDGDYIDLTLDQFDDYDDWIVAEHIESGRQLGTFMQKVRNQGGTLTTRELTFDGIPDDAYKLYTWLKEVTDSLLAASGQGRKPGGMPQLVSMDIHPQYRDKAVADQSDKGTKKKTLQAMTHKGTMTYCYQAYEKSLIIQ